MDKNTASRQKGINVTIADKTDVNPKSVKRSGSSRLDLPKKSALIPQDLKRSRHRVISDLLVIAIISIPIIFAMTIIYVISSIFFP